MNAIKKSVLGAALSAVLSFGSVAHAGVIVDLFIDPVGTVQSVTTSTVGATVTDQAGPFPSTNVIGQYRDLSINKTFDNVGLQTDGASTLTAGGGALQLDNATGNKSIGVVTWDGSNNAGDGGSTVNTTGLGGIDLTAGGADHFLADIIAADLGFDYVIRVWDMAGNYSFLSASVQFQVNPGDNVTASYDFAWFNLANGPHNEGGLSFNIARSGIVDFTDIGALQLELSNASTISVDLALGTIRTVPEPGALALLGVALLGAAAATRRQRSRSAS